MLSFIRNAINGPLAYVIVGLVIVAFGVFGVPELGRMVQQPALTIGGEKIPPQTLDYELKQLIQRQEAESQTALSRKQALDAGLGQLAMERIITRTLWDSEADKFGLGSSEQQVRDYINDIPNFKNTITGKLDNVEMARALRQIGMSVRDFEKEVRNDLRRNQLTVTLRAPADTSRTFAKFLLLRQDEARAVTLVNIDLEKLGEIAEPSEQEIQAYYEQNTGKFIAPEYRTFKAVILRPTDFAEGLSVSEEDVQTLWALRKDQLAEPERRSLRTLTYRSEEEANNALQRLRAGTDFTALAAEQNIKLTSITQDNVKQSDLYDKNIAEAAFALPQKGIVDRPLKTPLGYKIVEVISITPSVSISFEDARGQLEQELLEEDTSRKMIEAIEAVEELLDTGMPLEEALQEGAGLSMQIYGPVDQTLFTPGGAIVDNLPAEILNEAFLLPEGDETPALPLETENGYFFLSLMNIQPPARKPLAEVRDTIIALWKAEKTNALLQAEIDAITAKVADGVALEDVAAEKNYALNHTVVERAKANDLIPPQLHEQLFYTNLKELAWAMKPEGDGVVIARIDDVSYPPLLQGSDTMINLYKQALGAQISNEAYMAYQNVMQDEEGVKINEAVVSALFQTDNGQ